MRSARLYRSLLLVIVFSGIVVGLHVAGFVLANSRLHYSTVSSVGLSRGYVDGVIGFSPIPGKLSVCLRVVEVKGLAVNVSILGPGGLRGSFVLNTSSPCKSVALPSVGVFIVTYRVLEAPAFFGLREGSRAWLVVELEG